MGGSEVAFEHAAPATKGYGRGQGRDTHTASHFVSITYRRSALRCGCAVMELI